MLNFENTTILLASKSPRRKTLLQELGLNVKIVVTPDIDEIFPDHLAGSEIPLYLARLKSDSYTGKINEHSILLTADTIVWIDNLLIGKPNGRDGAIAMLKKLSGRKHQVYTGVCLKYRDNYNLLYEETNVYFRNLTGEEITYYVDKYKPYDKAGAYGVQEWIGFVGVERIEGSYSNVMGLPTHKVYTEICKLVK
jgi:septum formation protein